MGADDLLITMKPLEGYQVEREGSHAVALELEIDGALRAEGLARDVVHAVQQRRRDAGLEVSDRITLILDGDAELLDAVRAHHDYVAGETLALKISYTDLDGAEPVMIDGKPLRLRHRDSLNDACRNPGAWRSSWASRDAHRVWELARRPPAV